MMPENPPDDKPMDRQDRADLRADRSDSRMDRSDVRADRSDLKSEGEHKTTTELLEEIQTSLLDLDKRIEKATKDLDEERRRDRAGLVWLRRVAALALFASAVASLSAYSNCGVANENRDTIRAIIDKANSLSNRTAVLLKPEENAMRMERQRQLNEFVDSKTERVNCINPASYIRKPHR